jgi:hypothetical protein
MARKKKKDDVSAPPTSADRHLNRRLIFYAPHDLFEALEEEAEASDRTWTAVIVRALKEYLGPRGRWPRQPPPPAGQE